MERKTSRGLLGCSLSYSLPHFLLFAKIANSKGINKRKKSLEKEFGHWDNFRELAKMCTIQEKWSGHFSKFKFKLISFKFKWFE